MEFKLTKYEKARVIGYRATQLSLGATPMIDTKGMVDALVIATKEFEAGLTPISIIRTLPNGDKVQVDTVKSVRRSKSS